MKIIKKITNNNGLSLIEMVVAIAIFSTVILAATQIFMSVVNGQRKIVAMQNVEDSLRYAFEMMSKELRYAQIIKTDGECAGMAVNEIYKPGAINNLLFKNSSDKCVDYGLRGTTRLFVDRDGIDLPITPDDIEINELRFDIYDFSTSTPEQQAQVTIKMKVRAVGKDLYKSETVTQTTISARFYNPE